MGKIRMSGFDVKAAVEELQNAAAGMRLLNLYDITPKTYLMKFGLGDRKVLVFIEVGVRMHITSLVRDKPKVPSQFTLKLRKHVRSWRLEKVTQLGMDRLVDFQFGTDDNAHHFIIELHGKGNFALTDHKYSIMMLLRSHKEDDVRYAVRETYPMGAIQHLPPSPPTEAAIKAAFEKATPKETVKSIVCDVTSSLFFPAIIEHCLLAAGVTASAKRGDIDDGSIDSYVTSVSGALATCWKLHGNPAPTGGVLFKKSTAADPPVAELAKGGAPPPTVYDDFSPVVLKQFEAATEGIITKLTSYSEAVDKHFYPHEVERVSMHNEKKESAPTTKKQKFYRDHQRRINELQSEEERNEKKGTLINLNYEEVQEAIDLINMALASGISWDQLKAVVRERQHEGHPVANTIHELHLERNSISLLVMDECDAEDDLEDADVQPVIVDVDIGQTAHANACRYFTMKKANHKKLEKTLGATEKAAAAAEKKGQRVAAKQGPQKREIHVDRNKLWFEKYYWFIASSGHLVIGARDNQQADDIVRRYLRPEDVFVHCDVQGAQPCVVKGMPGVPVYQRTLEEAGTMAVCRSNAWESKMSVSAWWAYASQVSKNSPTGEYLHPGTFAVRGKKNFLPAMPLAMGCGIVFKGTTVMEPKEVDSDPIPEDVPSSHSPPATAARTPLNSSCDASASGMSRQLSTGSNEGETPESPLMLPDPERSPVQRTPQAFPTSVNKKLSAKERRLQRASRNSDGAESSTTPETITSTDSRSTGTGGKGSSGSGGSGMPKSKRQLNKLKKIKKKYGEQDDDDRELAMQLLGNEMCKSQKAQLEEKRRIEETAPASDDEMPRTSSDETDRQGRTRVRFATETDVVDDVAADHEDMRRRTTSFEDEEAKRQERIKREMAEDFPLLTTSPSIDEPELTAAMVICAPFSALIGAKYRIEITPGPDKKGAAARQALHCFQQSLPLTPMELQAVKMVREEETINQLVGAAKLHLKNATRAAAVENRRHADPAKS